MKLPTQIAVQLGLWLLGMIVDYSITGHVIIGGFIGATIGLGIVISSKV